jgi:hypothetical protein
MNLLVIILLVLLCGGGGFYGFNSYRAGWGIPGGIGLVVVVLLILFLVGGLR